MKFDRALLLPMLFAVTMTATMAGQAASGILTDDIRITSEVLGYDLQYRVNVPSDLAGKKDLPVLFVTDGQSYIKNGKLPRQLNKLIKADRIEPVVTVFVDARDPDDLSNNRRNAQFMCNKRYLEFFRRELIPEIESKYPISRQASGRTILGVSFGGLNAACFGLMGSDLFSGVGMHSPATHPIASLIPAFKKLDKLPLKIFLTTGAPNDNTSSNRKFRSILRNKGYELKYLEVRAGHDWNNWRPLMDDALLYFYGR
ncbi:MAG: enterochelin esterase-like enzyme [Candidatus Azotimanducaceae bacterium]|jgi:enterochelin esterase-like enzyme